MAHADIAAKLNAEYHEVEDGEGFRGETFEIQPRENGTPSRCNRCCTTTKAFPKKHPLWCALLFLLFSGLTFLIVILLYVRFKPLDIGLTSTLTVRDFKNKDKTVTKVVTAETNYPSWLIKFKWSRPSDVPNTLPARNQLEYTIPNGAYLQWTPQTHRAIRVTVKDIFGFHKVEETGNVSVATYASTVINVPASNITSCGPNMSRITYVTMPTAEVTRLGIQAAGYFSSASTFHSEGACGLSTISETVKSIKKLNNGQSRIDTTAPDIRTLYHFALVDQGVSDTPGKSSNMLGVGNPNAPISPAIPLTHKNQRFTLTPAVTVAKTHTHLYVKNDKIQKLGTSVEASAGSPVKVGFELSMGSAGLDVTVTVTIPVFEMEIPCGGETGIVCKLKITLTIAAGLSASKDFRLSHSGKYKGKSYGYWKDSGGHGTTTVSDTKEMNPINSTIRNSAQGNAKGRLDIKLKTEFEVVFAGIAPSLGIGLTVGVFGQIRSGSNVALQNCVTDLSAGVTAELDADFSIMVFTINFKIWSKEITLLDKCLMRPTALFKGLKRIAPHPYAAAAEGY